MSDISCTTKSPFSTKELIPPTSGSVACRKPLAISSLQRMPRVKRDALPKVTPHIQRHIQPPIWRHRSTAHLPHMGNNSALLVGSAETSVEIDKSSASPSAHSFLALPFTNVDAKALCKKPPLIISTSEPASKEDPSLRGRREVGLEKRWASPHAPLRVVLSSLRAREALARFKQAVTRSFEKILLAGMRKINCEGKIDSSEDRRIVLQASR